MDPAYGARYRALYEAHWWWRARERLVLDLLDELRPARDWGRILDVGCGDGLFFEELSRLGAVQGVEPDAALVSPDGPWRERIDVRPFDASFAPDRRFDLILFLDVIEHMEDPRAALRHAADLLACDDARVVITVPAWSVSRNFTGTVEPALATFRVGRLFTGEKNPICL